MITFSAYKKDVSRLVSVSVIFNLRKHFFLIMALMNLVLLLSFLCGFVTAAPSYASRPRDTNSKVCDYVVIGGGTAGM